MMKDWQWQLIRKAVYIVLLGMDKQLDLPKGVSLPKSMTTLSNYVDGLQFEADLNETLQITSNALKDISNKMEEIHRIAATVKVKAPSAEDVTALKQDLQKISEELKKDQNFKAVMALAGALAGIIEKQK